MRIFKILFLALLFSVSASATDKPKLTLDEFFNWVEVEAVQ